MNPYNETIDNPINYFIQEDMLQKQLNGTGISYEVIHDWRPEYGTGNGTDSGYEDIANAKPKIFFDKDQVTVRDSTPKIITEIVRSILLLKLQRCNPNSSLFLHTRCTSPPSPIQRSQ